jgi:hypothetical protein
MIQEFCDRCGARVGIFYDGGKDEPKLKIDRRISELWGDMQRPYNTQVIVCSRCHSKLCTIVTDWWRNKA